LCERCSKKADPDPNDSMENHRRSCGSAPAPQSAPFEGQNIPLLHERLPFRCGSSVFRHQSGFSGPDWSARLSSRHGTPGSGPRRGCQLVDDAGEVTSGDPDPATGRPSEPPILPGWDAYPIAEHLQEHVADVPVHAANDADAAAVGESVAEFRGCRSLVMVKVSTGTGIVIGGQRYVGTDGGAGDIGHVRVEHPVATRCMCGSSDASPPRCCGPATTTPCA
jgi:hypothetical protein